MSPTRTTPSASATPDDATEPSHRAPKWIRYGIWFSFAAVIGFLVWNQKSYRVRWHLSSAQQSLAKRDVQSALLSLEAARQLDPENGELEYLSARADRKLGELDRVRLHLQRAHSLGFDTKLLETEQWLAAAQAGQMSMAEPHLQDLLIDQRVDGAEICEAFVNGYFRNYTPTKALPLLEGWKQDYPQDERPYHLLGSYKNAVGDFAEAEKDFREALRRAPDSTEIRSSLADCLMRQHKFADAEVLLKQNLDSGIDSLDIRLQWAECLWEQGKVKQAGDEFQALQKIDAGDERVQWGLARLADYENNYEQALKYVEPLVEKSPFNVEYRRLLARELQAVGRQAEATGHFQWISEATEQLLRMKTLKKRLRTEPDDPELRYQLGHIYLNYESPEEGVQLLLSVVDLDPDHEQARAELFDYYESRGLHELAERFAPKSPAN